MSRKAGPCRKTDFSTRLHEPPLEFAYTVGIPKEYRSNLNGRIAGAGGDELEGP
jgi:hypothetical protein